jgi:predicted flap endonuclease-1-like 5' DNA nuclease
MFFRLSSVLPWGDPKGADADKPPPAHQPSDAVSNHPSADSRSPADLRNLGPRTQQALAQAGIRSIGQLRRVGAIDAYLRMRQVAPGTSLNALYALVGALDDRDWRDVKRTRKLELLVAVEDAQQRGRRSAAPSELSNLRNIGPAMLRDFDLLGIKTTRQLARCDPARLYAKLEQLTGKRQDPCVLDTFSAAIHQARTGEALPWWHFSRLRKAKNGV